MNQVQTTQGLVDRDRLEVKEIVTEEDNSRSIATEWTLDGELVRRDLHIIMLRGQELSGDAANLG